MNSARDKAEDENEKDCVKNHPLFPYVLQAIKRRPAPYLPQNWPSGINRTDPDHITRILMDVLKLLEMNNSTIRGQKLENPINWQQQFANSSVKASESNIFTEAELTCRDVPKKGETTKRMKLPPECLSPMTLSRRAPRDSHDMFKYPDVRTGAGPQRGLSNMAKASSAEASIEKWSSQLEESRRLVGAQVLDVVEAKSELVEDDTDVVLAHPLFPYVLRAINDTDATNLPYMPVKKEERRSNELVTLILVDLLKLLEKRAIEKRRVLDGIKTFSTTLKAYLDIQPPFGDFSL